MASGVTSSRQIGELVCWSRRQAGNEALVIWTCVWGFVVSGRALLLYFGVLGGNVVDPIFKRTVLLSSTLIAVAICVLHSLRVGQTSANARAKLEELRFIHRGAKT